MISNAVSLDLFRWGNTRIQRGLYCRLIEGLLKGLLISQLLHRKSGILWACHGGGLQVTGDSAPGEVRGEVKGEVGGEVRGEVSGGR